MTSLDVVTLNTSLQPESAPFIDFMDGTYKVENPTVIGGQERFQFTADSFRDAEQGGPLTSEKTEAQVMSNQPDAIKGLQGVSPFAAPSVVGLGHNSDPYRVGSGGGSAWRVAEFSFQALQPSGTIPTHPNHLFLEIGFHGMRHEDDGQGNPLLATQVVFGTNASPIYTAGPGLSHRQTTLSGETFDVRINAVEFTPGDYDADGEIGAGDFDYWSSSFGEQVTPGDGADGNGDGVVNAADYVFLRKRIESQGASGGAAGDSAATPQPAIVPEPTAATLALILLAFGQHLVLRHREKS